MDIRELMILLETAKSVSDIDAHREEIASLFPQVRDMFGFDQKNPYHQYDLWSHSLHTVLNLGRETDGILYLAALLHDIGKPDSQVPAEGADGPYLEYFGHPERSLEIIRDEILPELRRTGNVLLPDEERRLLYYVGYHDEPADLTPEHLRRHLDIPVTLEEYQNLMRLQVADARAHKQIGFITERVRICELLSGEFANVLYEKISEKTGS